MPGSPDRHTPARRRRCRESPTRRRPARPPVGEGCARSWTGVVLPRGRGFRQHLLAPRRHGATYAALTEVYIHRAPPLLAWAVGRRLATPEGHVVVPARGGVVHHQ